MKIERTGNEEILFSLNKECSGSCETCPPECACKFGRIASYYLLGPGGEVVSNPQCLGGFVPTQYSTCVKTFPAEYNSEQEAIDALVAELEAQLGFFKSDWDDSGVGYTECKPN